MYLPEFSDEVNLFGFKLLNRSALAEMKGREKTEISNLYPAECVVRNQKSLSRLKHFCRLYYQIR